MSKEILPAAIEICHKIQWATFQRRTLARTRLHLGSRPALSFTQPQEVAPGLSKAPENPAMYNDSVPIEFTRALLVQARAYERDVDAILAAAGFPFDPLRDDVQTAFVSREQYSRLCLELVKELGPS